MVSAASRVDPGEHLSERNFQRLVEFIHGYCGIHLTDKKRTLLEGRLRRRMRETGSEDINQYCKHFFAIEGNQATDETVRLIDAITVNKTDFFREPSHFDYLQRTILPGLVDAGKNAFKIWSAASANGAEPYTLAMVLDEFCRSKPGADYFILATDISTKMIDQAIAGRYPLSALQPIPQLYRSRHLMHAKDRQRREFRIAPHLRAKMGFARINLVENRYLISPDYDVIFCRNVLIYFDQPTRHKVLRQLIEHLCPQGYLILGHAESIFGYDLPLISCGNTIFRKR
jgi:chemotaxis protein methyltransferase CheR